jgi:hypothetical protein
MLINDDDEMNLKPKTDDDVMGGQKDTATAAKKGGALKGGRAINAKIDWNIYAKNFETIPREALFEKIQIALFQVKPQFNTATINNYTDSTSREAFIKSVTLQLMSTPEYQMC